MLIDAIIHRRWTQIPHLWEAVAFSISMGIATFISSPEPPKSS